MPIFLILLNLSNIIAIYKKKKYIIKRNVGFSAPLKETFEFSYDINVSDECIRKQNLCYYLF